MSSLAGGLGLSGGYSSSSSKSTDTPTYSAGQSSLQGTLLDALTKLLLGGGSSPQLQALQTQSADQINKNFSGVSDRINSFLASRGFGQSGLTGGAALSTELGRQGALAGNTATYGGLSLNQFNTGLADALQFAFANPGSSKTSSGSSFGFGIGGSGGFAHA
jgi:hypothetical protein